MRLLNRDSSGKLVLSTFSGSEVEIPPYAILSHTWAIDNTEEVSFQDLEDGTGRNKPGYSKILFCERQAKSHGLYYFWIDTCSIDKKNAVELQEAINSMFRWYQKAAHCYVYLSDVSASDREKDGQQLTSKLGRDFRNSRWFTRGWTLQELIAPSIVQFFSSEGHRMGDKLTLEEEIHKITGISRNALKGYLLSDFTVDERMSWMGHRRTKLEEDAIYSLLGIFDVSMPMIYGEGKPKAQRRLQEEIEKSSQGM
jgi:hypothetical protein